MGVGTFDLFISDPLIVDLGLFGAWLEGLRVDDAVQLHPIWRESTHPDDALQELVHADCSDQVRLFWMLQPFFMDPSQLAAQRRYRMLPEMRRLVLDAYYGFDERVMRELLGRRPTPKLRRETEALRDKLNVSLRSCRRQVRGHVPASMCPCATRAPCGLASTAGPIRPSLPVPAV